jgi:CDP-4-dehydro-6-deoxyglucose reductase
VLECLTARGHALPHSCGAGVCQSCLVRAVHGSIPARAQVGLSPAMKAQNLLLACQCIPTEDIEVALATEVTRRVTANVVAIAPLTGDICALYLRPELPYAYHAGQFLRLYMNETTSRNYSLASVPALDAELLLHVRRVNGGVVSGWIFHELQRGNAVVISEALGECIYLPGYANQSLLLLATGSGLAPLYGIAREALHAGHRGDIHLYHGGRETTDLYWVAQLHALVGAHANFHYHPCVSAAVATIDQRTGRPHEVALRDNPNLSGWKVFLCGSPRMVDSARMECFLAGASMADICADAFLPSGPQSVAAALPVPA